MTDKVVQLAKEDLMVFVLQMKSIVKFYLGTEMICVEGITFRMLKRTDA